MALQRGLHLEMGAGGDLLGAHEGLVQRRVGLEALSRKHGVVGDIRGKGLFQGMEFVRNAETRGSFPASLAFGVRVGRRALENGLLCRFDPNWIALGPPLVVTAEHIDEIVNILDKSIAEVLDDLNLNSPPLGKGGQGGSDATERRAGK